MIMLIGGLAIGGLAGYILARILAYHGLDPIGPDPRTEGRLKLLESASLRHGASIRAIMDELERHWPAGDVRPIAEVVYTEGEDVKVVIGGDADE